jgi:hypothetical protein
MPSTGLIRDDRYDPVPGSPWILEQVLECGREGHMVVLISRLGLPEFFAMA